jgi:mannosyltransferase
VNGAAVTWSPVLVLAGLVVVAALLRFPFLGTQSLWYDEVVTAGLASGGFGDLLKAIPESESTPPVYYVLLWGWAKIVGTGDAGLRSLSAIAGVLTVPAAYAAGTSLVSRRAGLIVAAMAAVAPLLVWYSVEARSYALLVLFSTLTVAAFGSALRDARPWALAGWAVAACVAMGTHYFALFVVIPEAVWLLARARPLRRVVAACVPPAAVGAALLPLALAQRSHGGADFIADIPFWSRMGQFVKQFAVGYSSPLDIPLLVVTAVLAVVAVALLAVRADAAERRGAAVAAVLGVAVVVLALIAAAAGFDYVLTRNLLPAWVPFAIVVAAGFGTVRSGRMGLALAAVLVALWGAASLASALDEGRHRVDWKAAAEELGPAPPGGRAIVLSPSSGRASLERYLGPLTPMRTRVPVSEIAYLAGTEGRVGRAAPPPRTPTDNRPELGANLDRRIEAPTYTLAIYKVVIRPTPLADPEALAAFRLSPDAELQTLLQRPRP